MMGETAPTWVRFGFNVSLTKSKKPSFILWSQSSKYSTNSFYHITIRTITITTMAQTLDQPVNIFANIFYLFMSSFIIVKFPMLIAWGCSFYNCTIYEDQTTETIPLVERMVQYTQLRPKPKLTGSLQLTNIHKKAHFEIQI